MILKIGDINALVTQWQQALQKTGYGGYLGTSGPKGDGVDGQFGDHTVTATKIFQQEQGLNVDGEVGRQSVVKMRNLINGTDTPIPSIGDLPDTFTNLLTSSIEGVISKVEAGLSNAAKDAAKTGAAVAGTFPWKWVLFGTGAFLAYKKYRKEKVVVFGKRIV
jgi:peptidoglycan hydrolase-like protein with peptidoglycan-binding domain